MSAPTKDEEIRAVVAELDALLSRLQDNVDTLTAIIHPPTPPPSGKAQEVPSR